MIYENQTTSRQSIDDCYVSNYSLCLLIKIRVNKYTSMGYKLNADNYIIERS